MLEAEWRIWHQKCTTHCRLKFPCPWLPVSLNIRSKLENCVKHARKIGQAVHSKWDPGFTAGCPRELIPNSFKSKNCADETSQVFFTDTVSVLNNILFKIRWWKLKPCFEPEPEGNETRWKSSGFISSSSYKILFQICTYEWCHT